MKIKQKFLPNRNKHQNTEGKPSNSHGKPPHRGGAQAGGRRKLFFTIGGDKDGSPRIPEFKVASTWKPNVRRNKFKQSLIK